MTKDLLSAPAIVGMLVAPVSLLAGNQIYVSSEKDNALIVFDASTYEKRGVIDTSERPRALSFSPDRKLIYVASGEGDAIDVVDVATQKLVESLDVGEDPEMFDLSPDGKTLYASLEEDGELAIHNLASGETKTVEVGEEPEGVLAHPNGQWVYVTSEEANLVHVVDVQEGELLANITVGNRPRRFAVNPERKELWVTNEISGTVSIIDTASNKVAHTLEFSPKGFRKEQLSPVGLLFNKAGDTAYVGLGKANHVAVVDIESRTVKKYILVGKRAWGLALDSAEKRLFVANGMSDDMSIIDTTTLKVIKTIPVARVPHSILIDD